MNNISTFPFLLSGFLNNILICLAASVHPMLAGMTVLLIKRGRKVKRPCFAWNIAECIPPLVMMVALFYGSFRAVRNAEWLIVMVVLTISHTGYIPLHIRDRYTVRNYFVCAIDLFCSLLKWSTIAGYIAAMDIMRNAQIIANRTYTGSAYYIAFAILFGVLLLLQFVKWLIAKGGKESLEA